MSKKAASPYNGLRDGIITGAISNKVHACENCGTRTRVIRIAEIELPEGIEPSNRLICWKDVAFPFTGTTPEQITWLGINCGCYAKFHRQIAHIQDRKSTKGLRTDGSRRTHGREV